MKTMTSAIYSAVLWSVGISVLSAVCLQATAAPSELQNYVGMCQSDLGFTASQVPDTIDCDQGKLFDLSFTTPINDRVIYVRVNDKVDMVAACRWGNGRFQSPETAFISMELLIHNRDKGGTCFFAAKDVIVENRTDGGKRPIPKTIVTPTNFKPDPTKPGTLLANNFWLQPTELNNKKMPTDDVHTPANYQYIRCVGCHSQGPYIASKQIAPDLAGLGLINDGHDTRTDFNAAKHYYVVGSSAYNANPLTDPNPNAFKAWNSLIYGYNAYDCAGSCHMVSTSTQGSIFDTQPGNVTRVLPSIASDIDQYVSSGAMPPYADDSDIRWMNLATPWATGIEVETFERAKDINNGTVSSNILSNCSVPGDAEAIAVGMRRSRQFVDNSDGGGPPPPPWDDTIFSTMEMKLLPNRLNTFNLKEGLLCLNSEQPAGKTCVNYQTSYLCNDKWTDETLGYWFDTDSPTPTGDTGEYEQRSRITSGLCANPTGIKTRFLQGGSYVVVHGPTDRLAQFNKQRLSCNNKDQIDGQCSNYVVRYRNCASGTLANAAYVNSAWSSRLVTATNNGANNAPVKGQPKTSGWNTQKWMVEDEVNSPYVRLRNTGTNTYLNVHTQDEGSVVETYEIRDWDSQRWVMEPVPGSTQVRFKNVWSGKYLTLGDSSDYSAVYSQALSSANWASQRWQLSY
jgi:hypothetical protein